jgi:hypothetical protein
MQSTEQQKNRTFRQIGDLKIFEDEFLGKGATATVYRGEFTEHTDSGKRQVPVAVKKISKKGSPSQKSMNQEF